jgi:hypothetical protein
MSSLSLFLSCQCPDTGCCEYLNSLIYKHLRHAILAVKGFPHNVIREPQFRHSPIIFVLDVDMCPLVSLLRLFVIDIDIFLN